jgi:Xaa-Pro dipeptidase
VVTLTEQTSGRVQELQERLVRRGLDGAVFRLAENVVLLTGYYLQIGGLPTLVVPRSGPACLIVPDYEADEAAVTFDGEIRTFPFVRFDRAPAHEELARHLRELGSTVGLEGGLIGFEGSFESVAPPTLAGEPNAVGAPTQELIADTLRGAKTVDVTQEIDEIRASKTDFDLDRLRTVNEVAMIGLDAFKRKAVPGITEAGLAAEVEAAVLRDGHGHRGARVVRSWASVWSGPETDIAWQYFRSRPRRIESDDVVMIEMGTVADGYWCDHTRTVVAGKATARQQAAFDAARGATRAAFAAARPGTNGHQVDAAARAFCRDAGFDQFPHHTGHGTGFRYHEALPGIVPDSEAAITERMVIAIEPGIYETGTGGFRWEDDAVVGAEGASELATSDYGLD